jgi:hypothetical protein
MADLWGAIEETEPVESSTNAVGLIPPDTIVVQELINHDTIRSETNQLRMSLNCSAGIVVAAYNVADYIPNLRDSKHREFWQQQVSLIAVP